MAAGSAILIPTLRCRLLGQTTDGSPIVLNTQGLNLAVLQDALSQLIPVANMALQSCPPVATLTAAQSAITSIWAEFQATGFNAQIDTQLSRLVAARATADHAAVEAAAQAAGLTLPATFWGTVNSPRNFRNWHTSYHASMAVLSNIISSNQCATPTLPTQLCYNLFDQVIDCRAVNLIDTEGVQHSPERQLLGQTLGNIWLQVGGFACVLVGVAAMLTGAGLEPGLAMVGIGVGFIGVGMV
jgi:hypothetical protein